MNNTTQSIPTCQADNINFYPNLLGFSSFRPEISERALFEFIYSYSNTCKQIFMSYTNIGNQLDLHHDTIRKGVNKLSLYGVIQKRYRGKNKTCMLIMDAFFFTSAGRLILIIIFQISFLYVTSPDHTARPRNINNVTKTESVFAQQAEGGVKSFYKKETEYAISQVGTDCKPVSFVTPLFFEVSPEYYSISEYNFHVGTPFRNPVPDIFKKNEQTKTKKEKAKKMHNRLPFSEIQVDLMKMQPNEVYELATQTYDNHVAAGKIINNPTSYFMVLFNKQAALVKQNLQPKKQYSHQQQKSTYKPKATVIDHEATRETLNDRKDRIRMKAEEMGIDIHAGWTLGDLELMVNGYEVLPLTRTNNVRVETNLTPIGETPLQWSSKVEPILHQFTIDKNPGLKTTRCIADVYWNKLTVVEQATIMAFAHPDCECRTGAPTIATLSEVVTKPHEMKPIVTELKMAEWKMHAQETLQEQQAKNTKLSLDKLSNMEVVDNFDTTDDTSGTADYLFDGNYEEVFD